MAKRKGEEQNIESVADANAVSQEPGTNKEVELTESEVTANEVAITTSSGDFYKGKFKLKDPNTSFSDTNFTLAGDQEKELPENPSTELLARIRSGFIVKA